MELIGLIIVLILLAVGWHAIKGIVKTSGDIIGDSTSTTTCSMCGGQITMTKRNWLAIRDAGGGFFCPHCRSNLVLK